MAEDSTAGSPRRIVELSSQADDDRLEIYVYTEQLWGLTQAKDYDASLRSVMEQLANTPAIAPPAPGRKNTRVYTVRWKNARQGHRLFFPETEHGILVLRIRHTAMDDWLE